jgi:hypothetical protein
MFLARLRISVGGEEYFPVRVQRLPKTFVAGDIVSFFVQASGSSMAATAKMADKSKSIVIFGLMVQIVVFGFFMVTSVVFEKRMRRGSDCARLS